MNHEVLIAYFHGLGIMALLTMAYGQICRRDWNAEFKSALIGLCFGLGAVLAMATPVVIQPGVIIDARSIIIALGSAFGGFPAALISAGIAAAYRYELGGNGVLPGTLCIALASLIGLIWAGFVKPRVKRIPVRLAIFAAMSPFALITMFALPWDAAIHLLDLMIIPNTITSIIAAVVLGALLEKEQASIHSEEILRQRASSDALTGLGNRAGFDAQIERRLYEPGGRRCPTALLIVDADYFKSVNDRFGHAVGDAVLKRISDILKTAIGPHDFAARLGGEEFGILLETRSPNRALKVAENMRAEIEAERFEGHGQRFGVTVSVGCAIARKGETVESLYDSSDRALYDAKNNGRNQVSLAGYAKQSSTGDANEGNAGVA